MILLKTAIPLLMLVSIAEACVSNYLINDFRFSLLNSLIQRGNTIKSVSIRNCNENNKNVVRIMPNSSLFISDNCDIISNVCGEYDGFSTASVRIYFTCF